MSRVKQKTAFWRRCLVDTVFENGYRSQRKHGLIAQPLSCGEHGMVKNLPPLPKGASTAQHTRELQALTLFPEAWVLSHDHGLASTRHDTGGNPSMWLPFAVPVLLNRQDKRLWPAAQPYIPRDLLAPDWDSADQPIVARLSDHDAFRSAHPFTPEPPETLPPNMEKGSADYRQRLTDIERAHRAAWSSVTHYLDTLRKAICTSPSSALASGVLTQRAEIESSDQMGMQRGHQEACFTTQEPLSDAAIRQQLRVFDKLLENTAQPPPLYQRFAADAPAPERPLFSNAQGFRQRLAHSTSQHPLATAQRHAMNHLVLGCDEGDILAVNGPPGTGKTTLILSIVANLWTQAALEGAEYPPIIVGASATNQAVTNIIDAFYKDFDSGSGALGGRWLPTSLIWSYGTYRPSASALKREKKQSQSAAQDHSSPMFFQELLKRLTDTQQLNEASDEYLSRGIAWLRDEPTLGDAAKLQTLGHQAAIRYLVNTLHQVMQRQSQTINSLHETLQKAPELHQAWHASAQALSDALQTADNQRIEQQRAQQACESLNQLRDVLTRALAQVPAWLSFLSFIPSLRRKQELTVLATETLDTSELLTRLEATGLASGARGRLERVMTQLQAEIDESTRHQRIAEERQLAQQDAASTHRQRCNSLQTCLSHCHAKVMEQLAEDPRASALLQQADWSTQADTLLAIADEQLEPSLRFQLFRLATHYWEGRALLEAQALLRLEQRQLERLSNIAAGGSWHPKPDELTRVLGLYAMVAPAIVSTFSSLPSLFQVYHSGQQSFAYGLADLLIVDEGGQISPEVAAPGFALAKRAIVVGDTQQIAPVVTLGETLERQNLAECDLIDGSDDDTGVEAINHLGQGPTQGSVMRIAQQACAYHYLHRQRGVNGHPNGMFLDEHRRCFDEIIDYCNTLCYDGLLTLKRGRAVAPSNAQFSASDADSLSVSATDSGQPLTEADRATLRLQQLQPLSFWHIDGQCQERNSSRVNEAEALAVAQWICEHADALVARYSKDGEPQPLSRLVAVVTPFKAQANAIKHELSQALGGKAQQLTVGTVHSLQGAERQVVLFSGVYSGSDDGPFIDSAPSMLNVAVSRAKDHFIFIGDMHLLARQPFSKPRGLLYSYLTRYPGADIPLAFSPRLSAADDSTLEVIFNHQAHDKLMFEAIANAHQRVCILSPWVLQRELERPELVKALDTLRQRNADKGRPVPVWIYLDERFSSSKWHDSQHDFHAYLQAFAERHQVTFRLCQQLHAKMLLVDNDLHACGSFNWLSADRRGKFQMLESSSVVRGPQARALISQASKTLASLRDTSPSISASDTPSLTYSRSSPPK